MKNKKYIDFILIDSNYTIIINSIILINTILFIKYIYHFQYFDDKIFHIVRENWNEFKYI